MSEEAPAEEPTGPEIAPQFDPEELKLAWLLDTQPRQDGEKWPEYLAGIYAAYRLLVEKEIKVPVKLERVK